MTPEDIVSTKTFKSIKSRVSRYDYYKSLGACETILSFTKSEGKTFGTDMEKLVIEWFQLGKRTNTQNDATYLDRKIEIKSSRYWGCEKSYKFQHIELDHDFDVLLTVVLRENCIEYRLMFKSEIIPYLEKQGKQGHFLNGRDVEKFGKIVETSDDVIDYLTQIKLKLDIIENEVKCVIQFPK